MGNSISNPLAALLGKGGLGSPGEQKHPTSVHFKTKGQVKNDGMSSYHLFGIGQGNQVDYMPSASSTVQSVNYNLIVIDVLIQCGINPLQGQLTDFGHLGESEAGVETSTSNMSSFVSYLEGVKLNSSGDIPWDTQLVNDLKKVADMYNGLFYNAQGNPTLSQINIEINGELYSGTSSTIKNFLAQTSKATGVQMNTSANHPVSDITLYVLNKLQVGVDTWGSSKGTINTSDLTSVYSAQNDNVFTSGIKNLTNIMDKTVSGTGQTLGYWFGVLSAVPAALSSVEGVFSKLVGEYQKTVDKGNLTKNATSSMMGSAYQALSNVSQLVQGQSEILTNNVQVRTSQITSYVKIGQTMTSNSSKALKSMVMKTRAS